MNLEDKAVVVTGASGVIGGVIGEAFANAGARVLLGSHRRPDNAMSLAEKLRSQGSPHVHSFSADVSTAEGADALIDAAKVHLGGSVDVVVNAAGATIGGGDFVSLTEQDWISAFQANTLTSVMTSRAAAAAMHGSGRPGRIINISSIRGLPSSGRTSIMAYSAAKAALFNITATLAKDLAPDVLVNAIAPGFVKTSNYDSMSDELKDAFLNATLLKRWIPASEIADTALFLARTDSITGQTVVVDGGFSLKFQ